MRWPTPCFSRKGRTSGSLPTRTARRPMPSGVPIRSRRLYENVKKGQSGPELPGPLWLFPEGLLCRRELSDREVAPEWKAAADGVGDGRDTRRELGELIEGERLGAVGERVIRAGMDLDHEAVGSGGDAGK